MDAPDGQTWFNGALGFVAALLGLLWNMMRAKVDKLSADNDLMNARSAVFVTRDELQRYLDQVRSDRIQMHLENIGRLDRLDDGLIRLGEKVDRK